MALFQKSATYLALFSVLFFLPFSSFAGDNSSWAADKIRAEKFIEDGKCSEYWSVIWPWAKRGNPEARFDLLFRVVGFMHTDQIFPPGSSDDYVSRMRDWTTLAVHAQEYYNNPPSSLPNQEFILEYRDILIKVFELAGFRDAQGGEAFLSCVEGKGKDCSEIAIKNKLVPSFEEYAAQIDAFMARGMKSKCKENLQKNNIKT